MGQKTEKGMGAKVDVNVNVDIDVAEVQKYVGIEIRM